MNVLVWGGIVIGLVMLIRGPKANPNQTNNTTKVGILAYMLGRKQGEDKEEKKEKPTAEQIERRARRRNAIRYAVVCVILFGYAMLAEWGNPYVAGIKVALLVGVFGWFHYRTTRHFVNVVRPFYLAMCHLQGGMWPIEDRPARWIRVPRGASRTGVPTLVGWFLTTERLPDWTNRFRRKLDPWADKLWPVGKSSVRVRLPKDWPATPAGMAALKTLAGYRFPGDWNMRTEMRKFRVTFVTTRPLPRKVTFPEEWIAPRVGKELTVPIGMVADDKWAFIEMEKETPHTLVAAPTGFGKTTILLVLVGWVLMQGGTVDVIDPKRVGFLELEGMPGVRVHTDVESWPKVIAEYRASMEVVYKARENGEDIDDRTKFPTRLLVIDEKGSYTEMLKAWWKSSGKKGEPPTFIDEKVILWQGRFARHFMATGAQQANGRVLHSTDERDNYGARIAAGPQSAESWRMMFGGKRQACPVLKGRAFWSNGSEPVPIQLTYVSGEQLARMAAIGAAVRKEREAAAHGADTAPAGVSPDMSKYPRTPGETPEAVPGHTTDGTTEVVAIVGVEQGAEFLHMSKDAFEKARRRNPIMGEFRIGKSPAWNVTDLREWHSKRPIAGRRVLPPTENADEASGE